MGGGAGGDYLPMCGEVKMGVEPLLPPPPVYDYPIKSSYLGIGCRTGCWVCEMTGGLNMWGRLSPVRAWARPSML